MSHSSLTFNDARSVSPPSIPSSKRFNYLLTFPLFRLSRENHLINSRALLIRLPWASVIKSPSAFLNLGCSVPEKMYCQR
jgi:hypothetical protein